jgi:hypothetical protein
VDGLNLALAIRVALALGLVDLAAVVISGGVSLFGPLGASGFALRLALLFVVLLADFLVRGKRSGAPTYGYVAILLVLVPLLHFRGYRLRGDGLWYYSYAHSLAFDGDVDLANQYRSLGIDRLSGSLLVRETGRARFTYPVGAPLLWVPFVELGHAGVWLRNAYGLETAYDGFSDPYFHAVALANLLFGFSGMLVCDRLLRRWYPPWASFVAVTGVVAGSFLAWYLTYHAIYTHALTFLLVSVFLKTWIDGPTTAADYAKLGAVLGLAGLVRWQNLVFGLLPAIDLVERLWRREWRPVLRSGAALGAATFALVLPQLVTWKLIYDRFYLGVPLGSDYVRWNDPFLTETLFSSRHGLFSWSPILLFAALGLPAFVWKELRKGLPLLAVALVVWYVDSTVADWWGGGSFGGRRFDSVLPILALGLGTVVVFATDFFARHPRLVTGAVVGSFVLGNGLLMEQYRKGRIPVDDTLSWEAAAGGGLEDAFDAVGYPFSFPMNWIFALRYGRPKTQYDILVGKYLFDRMGGIGGVIDLGPSDPPFLGNGWSGLRDWNGREREVRVATGDVAGLFVPVDQRETLRIAIECASPQGVEPGPVEVRLNGTHLAAFVPKPEMSVQVMIADEGLWRRLNLLELVRLGGSGSSDGPFIAVDRLRFEPVPR